jgi:hypothetical protein
VLRGTHFKGEPIGVQGHQPWGKHWANDKHELDRCLLTRLAYKHACGHT